MFKILHKGALVAHKSRDACIGKKLLLVVRSSNRHIQSGRSCVFMRKLTFVAVAALPILEVYARVGLVVVPLVVNWCQGRRGAPGPRRYRHLIRHHASRRARHAARRLWAYHDWHIRERQGRRRAVVLQSHVAAARQNKLGREVRRVHVGRRRRARARRLELHRKHRHWKDAVWAHNVLHGHGSHEFGCVRLQQKRSLRAGARPGRARQHDDESCSILWTLRSMALLHSRNCVLTLFKMDKRNVRPRSPHRADGAKAGE